MQTLTMEKLPTGACSFQSFADFSDLIVGPPRFGGTDQNPPGFHEVRHGLTPFVCFHLPGGLRGWCLAGSCASHRLPGGVQTIRLDRLTLDMLL